jgi:hypothetical protein
MPRFLIEVPHEAEKIACARAVRLLLQTGSHYLTHADFGCGDGDHRGWIIVEVEARSKRGTRCRQVPVRRRGSSA